MCLEVLQSELGKGTSCEAFIFAVMDRGRREERRGRGPGRDGWMDGWKQRDWRDGGLWNTGR